MLCVESAQNSPPKNTMMRLPFFNKFLLFIFCLFFIAPSTLFSQEETSFSPEIERVYKAKVQKILNTREELIPGTDTKHTYQTISFIILDKDQKGRIVTVDNDFSLLEVGDTFFVKYLKTFDEKEIFQVSDVDRTATIISLLSVFIFIVILFGGKQGFFALVSLLLTFISLFYILFPALLAGYDPVLSSAAVSILLLCIIMFLTHGVSRKTVGAFLGSSLTTILAFFLSSLYVSKAKLTGYVDDESVYLNFNTKGAIDFSGLLLGSIVIGTIGIIDDVAITQASLVSQIKSLAGDMSFGEVFRRAMSVGKDHLGAVVNSLILAYTGASLPLLLLVYSSDSSIAELISREGIATEIVRTLLGSMSLILVLPITTVLAIALWRPGEENHHHHHHH